MGGVGVWAEDKVAGGIVDKLDCIEVALGVGVGGIIS